MKRIIFLLIISTLVFWTSSLAQAEVPPDGNNPPACSITSPTGLETLVADESITISVSASDSDGSVAKVEFYLGSTKLGEDTSAPYSYTWDSASEGSYSLTAKATDNESAQTTSSPVGITVLPAPVGSDARAHWRLDGNVVDCSGNGHHGIIIGDPVYVDGKCGQALSFDGGPDGPGGDAVLVPGTDGFGRPEEFTVMAWVFCRNDVNSFSYIVNHGTYKLYVVNGRPYGSVSKGTTGYQTAGNSIQPGEWFHIAMVCESDKITMFIDGEQVGQMSTTTAPFAWHNLKEFNIGASATSPRWSSYCFDGEIDDVRFYDRALNFSEVRAAREEGNPAPPEPEPTPPPPAVDPNSAAHWAFDGNVADSSEYGYDGSIVGNPVYVAGKHGQALSFNGIDNARVQVPDLSGLYGASNFTVAAWIRSDDPSPWREVMRNEDGGPAGFTFFTINGDLFANVYHPYGSYRGGYQLQFGQVSAGQWIHAAMTCQAGYLRLYLNGAEVGSWDTGQSFSAGPRMDFGDFNGDFAGDIDDVRLYARCLDDDEIASFMNEPEAVLDPVIIEGASTQPLNFRAGKSGMISKALIKDTGNAYCGVVSSTADSEKKAAIFVFKMNNVIDQQTIVSANFTAELLDVRAGAAPGELYVLRVSPKDPDNGAMIDDDWHFGPALDDGGIVKRIKEDFVNDQNGIGVPISTGENSDLGAWLRDNWSDGDFVVLRVNPSVDVNEASKFYRFDESNVSLTITTGGGSPGGEYTVKSDAGDGYFNQYGMISTTSVNGKFPAGNCAVMLFKKPPTGGATVTSANLSYNYKIFTTGSSDVSIDYLRQDVPEVPSDIFSRSLQTLETVTDWDKSEHGHYPAETSSGDYKLKSLLNSMYDGEWLLLRFKLKTQTDSLFPMVAMKENSNYDEGILTFTTDSGGDNQAPTADAGPNQTITLLGGMGSVILSDSSANDPDDDPITYEWTGSGATFFPGSDVLHPTASFTATGSYTLSLRVYDGTTWSTPDSVTVTVNEATAGTTTETDIWNGGYLSAAGYTQNASYRYINVSETGQNAILIFQLPVLDNEPITDANLYDYVGRHFGSPGDVDLYALRVDNSPAITTADYYSGPNDTSNAQKIMDEFVTSSSGPEAGVNTTVTGDATLAGWLRNNAYASGGTPSGAYAIFRLSAESEASGNGYVMNDASGNPAVLSITTGGEGTPRSKVRKSDFVVDFDALLEDHAIYTYRGNDGALTALSTAHADALAATDVNGGGIDDIVVEFEGTDDLEIFYDNSTVSSTISGVSMPEIATGDLDGDGQQDLVVGFDNGQIWAFFNNTEWQVLHAGNDAELITTANLDGLGADELIASFSGGSVRKYGTSSGWTDLSATVAGHPRQMVAGDAIGAGSDAVFFDFGPASPGISVYLEFDNTGLLYGLTNAAVVDGLFTTGDLDGDGREDLIFSHNASTGLNRVYFDGEEIISETLANDEAKGAELILTADFDGEGTEELIVSKNGGIYAMLNGGSWIHIIGLKARHLVAANLGGGGGNDGPVVDILSGPSSVTKGDVATYSGSYSDDGQPDGATVTTLWSENTGDITIYSPLALSTAVEFPKAGTYTLRLTADDTDLQGHDDINITVTEDGGINHGNVVTVSMGPHDFSWTLDKAVDWGTFVDGQPWIVMPEEGGVNLVSATPARLENQTVCKFKSTTESPNYFYNATINVTVKNPPVGTSPYKVESEVHYDVDEDCFGWDSRGMRKLAGWNPTLGWDPVTNMPLNVGDSVTTPKSATGLEMLNRASNLEALAVLTVLVEPPPAGAFRPGCIRSQADRDNYTFITLSDVRTDADLSAHFIHHPTNVLDLAGNPVTTTTPSRLYRFPYLDQLLRGPGFLNYSLGKGEGCSAWYNDSPDTNPNGNAYVSSSYGGAMGMRFGQLAIGSLAEWLTATQRQECRERLIQRAIDAHDAVRGGMAFYEDCGIQPGYSTLITVAGAMLKTDCTRRAQMLGVNEGVNGFKPWWIFADYAMMKHTFTSVNGDMVNGEALNDRRVSMGQIPIVEMPVYNMTGVTGIVSTTADSFTMPASHEWPASRPMYDLINMKMRITGGTGAGSTIYVITRAPAETFRKDGVLYSYPGSTDGYNEGGTMTVSPPWHNGVRPNAGSKLAFSITTSEDENRWLFCYRGRGNRSTTGSEYMARNEATTAPNSGSYMGMHFGGTMDLLMALYALGEQDKYRSGMDHWAIDAGTRPGYAESVFSGGTYLNLFSSYKIRGALWRQEVINKALSDDPEIPGDERFIYNDGTADALEVPSTSADMWYEM